ncbi:MAG: ribokinase, partial [Candidatus Latescibacteria bacterium]|nr:ribokinase [Candidatus Latescibacterota bacterium]
KDGENSIIVAPGANSHISLAQTAPDVFIGVDLVLAQLEVPTGVVAHTFEIARASGLVTILNPAPACELPPWLLERVDILTPNVNEAIALVGGATDDPE